VVQGFANLGADVQAQIHGQDAPLGLERDLQAAEVHAADELHDQEVLPIVAQADIEDLDDVAVAQEREHLGFRDE